MISHLQNYIEQLDPKILKLKSLQNASLKLLSGGHHNANYLLTFAHTPQKFVLRFYAKYEAGSDVIVNEYQRLKSLPTGFASEVFFLDKPPFLESSLLIMEFNEGMHVKYEEMSSDQIKPWE